MSRAASVWVSCVACRAAMISFGEGLEAGLLRLPASVRKKTMKRVIAVWPKPSAPASARRCLLLQWN
jgi:hypothetical protein